MFTRPVVQLLCRRFTYTQFNCYNFFATIICRRPKLETAQMRADRKCSLVNFERRFDLILFRAENKASQT